MNQRTRELLVRFYLYDKGYYWYSKGQILLIFFSLFLSIYNLAQALDDYLISTLSILITMYWGFCLLAYYTHSEQLQFRLYQVILYVLSGMVYRIKDSGKKFLTDAPLTLEEEISFYGSIGAFMIIFILKSPMEYLLIVFKFRGNRAPRDPESNRLLYLLNKIPVITQIINQRQQNANHDPFNENDPLIDGNGIQVTNTNDQEDIFAQQLDIPGKQFALWGQQPIFYYHLELCNVLLFCIFGIIIAAYYFKSYWILLQGIIIECFIFFTLIGYKTISLKLNQDLHMMIQIALASTATILGNILIQLTTTKVTSNVMFNILFGVFTVGLCIYFEDYLRKYVEEIQKLVREENNHRILMAEIDN